MPKVKTQKLSERLGVCEELVGLLLILADTWSKTISHSGVKISTCPEADDGTT